MFHAFSELPQVNILLVDDDYLDIEAIKRGFKKHNIGNPLIIAHDGIEALRKIREGIKPPFIILLDINMPGMNGLEFLHELRKDPKHGNSIVFVLTTSDHERDLSEAYQYNISGYLLKSNMARDFVNVMEVIDSFRRNVLFPPVVKAPLKW